MPSIVLVTGASSGFGKDTAETLATAGHTVFAGVRDVTGRNAGVVEDLARLGIVAVELDVTSDAGVEAAVQAVLARSGGRLDVVINNAGIASAGVSETFTAEQLHQLFDVNVFGIQRVLRATLPSLRASADGLVINIGSILGRVTFPFFGLYGASKFAVEALTDTYRYELRPLGVDVVLVQPSAYPTNMYATIQQPADIARAESYGEIAAIPGKMFETFVGLFQSANAPEPHDVATAIAAIVGSPKGTRAPRVVVGTSFGADYANAALAPIQAGVIDGLGLGILADDKTA